MDPLAQAAIQPIRPGMVVGLGTGRAAARAVNALADRNAQKPLSLTCVATSRATEQLAASRGLRVVDLNDVARIDYLFDGADEVDQQLYMIKGGGAAMTRERIVARACLDSGGQAVFLVDSTKMSARLGAQRKVPVEVLPLARAAVARALRLLGVTSTLRVTSDGTTVITDNGGVILDGELPADLAEPDTLADLAAEIRTLPGVVDHGLFLTECQTLLIEHAGRTDIERRTR